MLSDFVDCRVETFEFREKKKHGREEHYTYYQFEVPDDFPGREKWKKLRTIGVAIRFSKCGGTQTDEVRYYINSLALNVSSSPNRCVDTGQSKTRCTGAST